MENSKGYVYILTNPSFREDWVKIGKSSREVDVRSKELDNTAVPLPFEIYATVKTSKYNEVEKHLHKILTDLADKRIRKGREFFNIKPEEAYRYLISVAEMIDDAEFNYYAKAVKRNDKKELSERGKNIHDFWAQFNTFVEKSNYNIATRKPCYGIQYNVTLDSSKYCLYVYLRHKDNQISVGLWIKDDKAIYDSLYLNKDKIEAALPFKLIWNRQVGKKASDLYSRIDNFSLENTENHEKLYREICERLMAFKKVLKPYLK